MNNEKVPRDPCGGFSVDLQKNNIKINWLIFSDKRIKFH